MLRSLRQGLFANGDASVTGIEVLAGLVDELCTAAPTVAQRSCRALPGARQATELPAALEDLAVALAERGREQDARTALNEAVSRYEGLQARWDIERAEGRLSPHGLRRGGRSQRIQRAAFGWAALTPTEVKIAVMVARGGSTSDIAMGMSLSRRTVQTYISHILAKLGAKGRVDIVREALRQGVSP